MRASAPARVASLGSRPSARPRALARTRAAFDCQPPRATHAPALPATTRNLNRTIREWSGVFERYIFQFNTFFYLLTVLFCVVYFCFVTHWRCSVYFQYGRLFTVSTCWILIYLCRSESSSWFIRTRWDRHDAFWRSKVAVCSAVLFLSRSEVLSLFCYYNN